MYTVNSVSISENYKASQVPPVEYKFQISNGNTGEVTISDPLLDTLATAQERAKSEFLKTSYALREIRFTTWRTDLTKNQVIRVRGLDYLIKSLTISATPTSIKTSVRAVRYE